MLYCPKITESDITANRQIFCERIAVFEKKGLSFETSRRFILDKSGPLKGSILEIGTGTGHTALALAKAGYRFRSVDRDQDALRKAALNLAYANLLSKVELYIMDAAELEFADQSADFVVTVNFFHHLEGACQSQALTEIDRVLVPGGKAIMADFNAQGLEVVAAVHAEEGRCHENSGMCQNDVAAFFSSLNYGIQSFEDAFHWLLVSEKRSKEDSRLNAG